MELTNEFRVSAPPERTYDVLTDVERIAPMMPGAQLQEIEGDDYRGTVKVKVGPITAQYKGTATFEERDRENGRVVLKAQGRDTRGAGNASALITAQLTPDGEGTNVKVSTDLAVSGKVAQFGRGVMADVSAKLIGQFVERLEADLSREGDSEGSAGDAAVVASGTAAAVAGSTGTAEADTVDAGSADPGSAEAGTGETGSGAGGSDVAASGDAAGSGVSALGDPAGSDVAALGDAAGSGAEAGSDGASAESAAPSPPSSAIRRIDSPEAEPVDLMSAAGGSVAKRAVPLLAGFGVLVLLGLLFRRKRSA